MFLRSIKLDGLLSFAPGTEAFELQPLNVVIGPNGSGKSNLIEAIELLKATPTSFSDAIREGGGVEEWIWKGNGGERATMEVLVERPNTCPLRYGLSFNSSKQRLNIVDEFLADEESSSPEGEPFYYYRTDKLGAVLRMMTGRPTPGYLPRRIPHDALVTNESVLSQRKDPESYPVLSWCGANFGNIQTFREWNFGRDALVRHAQPIDLPTNKLLPGAQNLALLLGQLDHEGMSERANQIIRRLLPRFRRYSVLPGSLLRFFFHEDGLATPVSSTRLSDGTIRFVAMLVLLLMSNPPPLICIEEPELGLHPDALTIIAELLVEASARTQLIVTTHSDALVSALSAHVESIVVCEHRGGTVLSRLEAEKLSHWLERYRLGDLWRMGELGGNP